MSILSQVYNEILGDKEGTQLYFEFLIQQHIQFPLLECACGNGDLLSLLSKIDDQVIGVDLDHLMVEKAKLKVENVICQDMLNLSNFDKFKTILCLGDSLNYLSDIEDVKRYFNEVSLHLESGGKFIFDIHSLDRLDEFKEPYIEEGFFSLGEYQWTIHVSDNLLQHQFVFFINDDVIIEQVEQKVFNPYDINDILYQLGFNFTVYTDFNQAGYQQGEKYFYCVTKE